MPPLTPTTSQFVPACVAESARAPPGAVLGAGARPGRGEGGGVVHLSPEGEERPGGA